MKGRRKKKDSVGMDASTDDTSDGGSSSAKAPGKTVAKLVKEGFTEFRSSKKSAYKTIKIPLKSILLNRKTVHPVVTDLVFLLNDLTIHAYQFIRLYVLHCVVVKDQPVPTIDETFIRYCINTLGTKNACGPKCKDVSLQDELKRFYEEEYQPLLDHEKPSLTNLTQILLYAATQIHTAIHNNIQERFVQHFLRFVNKTVTRDGDAKEDKEALHLFKKRILNLSEAEETEERFLDWKRDHLSNILPTSGTIEKSINYDVKVRPFDYLKGMIYMNSVLEKQPPVAQAQPVENKKSRRRKSRKRNAKENSVVGNKLFQPLPLRTNIIPKHITLDTKSLIVLFNPTVMTDDGTTVTTKALCGAVVQYQEAVWGEMLNLKHAVFRNRHYTFDHQIQTDGVSCSLLFIRKDLKTTKREGKRVPQAAKEQKEQEFHLINTIPKEQLDTWKEEKRIIVGCDPGKQSLVYMMDGSGKKLQYTAPQRRRESKAKTNQRILLTERRRNGIVKMETKVSEYNSKSVDYDTFKAYLVEKTRLNADASEFYKREEWRKMKFRQYSYGKKSIDTFLNKIQETFGEKAKAGEEKRKILIGYGNWSQGAGQMRHLAPTLGKGLRKLIHQRYDTITIDECNTSKKCCGCHNDLENYKDTGGEKIHRLQTCSTCVSYPNKHTVFRTRDANSAVNMMRLTSGWIKKQERPLCFQHSQTLSFTSMEESSVDEESVRP